MALFSATLAKCSFPILRVEGWGQPPIFSTHRDRMILFSKEPTFLEEMKTWVDLEKQKQPFCDVENWQRRINNITGLSPTGFPIVRIAWAPDLYHVVNGELVRKYHIFRAQIDDVGVVEIAPPRFILEERIEPAMLEANWNAARMGPLTAEGMYRQIRYIAEHSNNCCAIVNHLWRQGKLPQDECFGKFRRPGEDILNQLAATWRQIEKHRKTNPMQPLTEADLDEAFRTGELITAQMTAKADKDAADRATNMAEEFFWQERPKSVPRFKKNEAGNFVATIKE